ncbi:hypothetical protein R5R35_009723 [Gryllus longicercus]|uniref:Alkyl transferase n=1 Tax=Gryllus longicercus TaxID=2509291 RepID=A0AAN9Z853_9ORTH
MSWLRENTLNWIQYVCLKVVKSGGVPNHVAFIMDGNRRFAKKNNVAKVEGHTKGFDKLAETLQWCLDLGIPEVTVYAFSIENFKRSTEEVNELMDLARDKFKRLLDEREKLMDHGVSVRVIGNLALLPEDLRQLMSEAMILTKDNNKAFLNIAFAYTSRDEITSAIKSLVAGVEKKIILPEDISKHVISQCLYTNKSPNPDLLIRTSGEIRLSDFLLWQTSSTCVYFSKVLWPEFSVWHMLTAVFHYQRNRQNIVRLKNFEESCSLESCSLENHQVDLFLEDLHSQRQMFMEKARQAKY